MTIGLGVVTYNRPHFAAVCVDSILTHCRDAVDHWMLYDDASDDRRSYQDVFDAVLMNDGGVLPSTQNRGVGYAKNQLLRHLVPLCDWVILVEDDMQALSPLAVTGYVGAAERNGLHHLSFAHHGPANAAGPVDVQGEIEFYPHTVGAWCLYSREMIEAVGMFDDQMVNAWEHVEHEMRAYVKGYAKGGGPWRFADVAGSHEWVTEQPNAIELSAIRARPDWQDNIVKAREHWSRAHPNTLRLIFG